MFPISWFVSESTAADLLQQVRWRDGVECSRCRSDLTVRNGSYRENQRYLCKNCGRTFNDKTDTIFAHSKLSLTEWYFMVYVFLRFNTSIRQVEAELNLSYRTVRRRAERFVKRSRRLRLRCLGRSKSMKCTSPLASKAASATPGRARVACPHVDQERTMATNRRCSRWSIVVRTTGTSCQRNSPTNRPSDSCLLTTNRSH